MFSTKKIFASSRKEDAAAHFRIGDMAGTQGSTDFFVRIEDPQTIRQARHILEGLEPPMNVGGTIVKETACWNPGWSYHYDPSSVYLFENAVEVCDAAYLYVEENLQDVGGAFLPGNNHCNWSSFLIEEVDESCPQDPGLRAYCCEVADSYSSISNTRRVNVRIVSQTPAQWIYIEVDYGDGNGWVGFNHINNQDCSSMCSFEAPLFPGVGYQRYRVRFQDKSMDPTETTPWSYTNPVMEFNSNLPTNNPIC